MRLAVWRCLAGAVLSASRISSITGRNGPSFGFPRGAWRRYPGGAGWARIFFSVLHPMPNSRHTERFESFSTSTLRRMVVHSFMSVCTLLPSALSPSWPGSLGGGQSRFGDGQVLSFSTGIFRPRALSFSTGVYMFRTHRFYVTHHADGGNRGTKL